jgi:hypothetical protein
MILLRLLHSASARFRSRSIGVRLTVMDICCGLPVAEVRLAALMKSCQRKVDTGS